MGNRSGVLTRSARLLPRYWKRFRRDVSARFLVPVLDNPEAELRISLDLVLAHYHQTHPNICFLQVGAFDGISGDPLYPLIEKYGLKGYLAEPQGDAFAKLRANYARFPKADFQFIQAAIGERDGEVPLYRVKSGGPGPDWLPQIASLDKSYLLSLTDIVPELESLIEVEQVECLTFATLFQRLDIPHIDLLQIDAEGLDAEILRLFDVAQRRPAIVHFEHKHLSEEAYRRCLDALIPLGYKISISRDDTLAYLVG
ncbi:MAG TPA: FkbM family methyltransferase [Bryobacteraceae bacterium]|jgi:FkbM family methyltransferase